MDDDRAELRKLMQEARDFLASRKPKDDTEEDAALVAALKRCEDDSQFGKYTKYKENRFDSQIEADLLRLTPKIRAKVRESMESFKTSHGVIQKKAVKWLKS